MDAINSIDTVAQNVMDLYYQQYKPEEAFLDHYHFRYLCAASYAKLLQDEFEKSKQQNAREEGIFVPQLNADWFIEEEISAVSAGPGRYQVKLKNKVFSFRFDKQSSGILEILPLSGSCRSFIRMRMDEYWKLGSIPATSNVYWLPIADEINFYNVGCGMSKVKVFYIPAISDDKNTEIPMSLVEPVMQSAWNFLQAARSGVVVDLSNDQNTNKSIETEIASYFKKLFNQ